MTTKDRKKADRARAQARRKAEQDVVYTQPKPFNRNRFLLQLATVAAVVLALLFGMSLFFKVQDIQISGTVKYDPWAVREASGIVDGENLLTLNKDRINANIRDKLGYIDTIQVGTKLPGTVVIHVTELEVVYAAQDQEGGWWLISSDGRVVDTCTAAAAEDYTRVLGVQLAAPQVGADAVAYEPAQEPDADGQTVPVTVYARERLELAVNILQNMERHGFIGTIATVDVTETGDIQMWYGTRFQMLLGDSSDLSKKLDALSQALDQMDDYDTGVLDASFTTWPTQVGHSQFP